MTNSIARLKAARENLDEIGKRLEIMRQIASFAATKECDPKRREELSMLFEDMKKELNGLIHSPVWNTEDACCASPYCLQ